MYFEDKIWMAKNEEKRFLLPPMANRHGLVTGATGTGKTMLSICIGMEACQKGIPVKFFRTAALINQLSEAQERGTLSQLHKRMDKAEIIILDEFGYVPYNRTGSQLLFDYLSEIHEKKVIILNNLFSTQMRL